MNGKNICKMSEKVQILNTGPKHYFRSFLRIFLTLTVHKNNFMKILCKYDKREKGFKLFSGGGGQHDSGCGVQRCNHGKNFGATSAAMVGDGAESVPPPVGIELRYLKIQVQLWSHRLHLRLRCSSINIGYTNCQKRDWV